MEHLKYASGQGGRRGSRVGWGGERKGKERQTALHGQLGQCLSYDSLYSQ